MKLAELIASFDKRADATPRGKYFLTDKQMAFARALADRERVSLDTAADEAGVSFRTLYIGKNAQFYGTKHFALVRDEAKEANARTWARVSAK